MAQKRRDTLPDSIDACDLELAQIAQALPSQSPRSRDYMLARSDRLLDRRLLLSEVAKRPAVTR